MHSLAEKVTQRNTSAENRGAVVEDGSVRLDGGPLVGQIVDESPSLLGILQDCLPPPLEGIFGAEIPPEKHVSARRVLLMELGIVSADLLNNVRVYNCLRTPLHKHGGVEVRVAPGGAVYLHGLMRCGLIWICPSCASKVSELRKNEVEQGVGNWTSMGNTVSLVTKTLRHDASMSLQSVLDGLQRAQDRFYNGMPARRLLGRYNVSGSVKALEVTVGPSGWHAHLHELLLHHALVRASAMETDMLLRWASSLRSVGMDCNEHGLQVTSGDLAAAKFQARYVAKFGEMPKGSWSIAQEIAKAVSKLGRSENRTPLDLLVDASNGDELAGALYREYAVAFFGKKHLRYSKGTRSLLGLAEGQTDEELANSSGPTGSLLKIIASPSWLQYVEPVDRRVQLLESFVDRQPEEVKRWSIIL